MISAFSGNKASKSLTVIQVGTAEQEGGQAESAGVVRPTAQRARTRPG